MIDCKSTLFTVGRVGTVKHIIAIPFSIMSHYPRDLKPGNLLVNSNCLLKICDFGFARAVEPDPTTPMTLEVVTQYYRAPELLAGCNHYDVAIDMWAVGCIFAELLGRRILFEASTPNAQVSRSGRMWWCFYACII